VVPSTRVVAVKVPVDSRMTIVKTVFVVWFATWNSVKYDNVGSKNNWLVVYQLGKCLGDKDVKLKGSLDKAHMGLEF